MTSKKTKVVSGRVPHNTVKEMNALDLKVPEAVQIAIKTKRDPQELYKAELRSLLAEQEILASKLANVNLLIDKYLSKLNINKTVDELKQEFFVDENEKAIQTTLKRFYRAKGETALHMNEFLNDVRNQEFIEFQLSKCDMTKEDFFVALIERYDKSIQTKLDS